MSKNICNAYRLFVSQNLPPRMPNEIKVNYKLRLKMAVLTAIGKRLALYLPDNETEFKITFLRTLKAYIPDYEKTHHIYLFKANLEAELAKILNKLPPTFYPNIIFYYEYLNAFTKDIIHSPNWAGFKKLLKIELQELEKFAKSQNQQKLLDHTKNMLSIIDKPRSKWPTMYIQIIDTFLLYMFLNKFNKSIEKIVKQSLLNHLKK